MKRTGQKEIRTQNDCPKEMKSNISRSQRIEIMIQYDSENENTNETRIIALKAHIFRKAKTK
jgi:hypothetical protein